jgi:putative ABC transport system permease protein
MHLFRLALRSLRRSPAFSLIAGLALALGIGANTAVFSVVNAVLLKPLPYPEAGRVVRVFNHWDGTPSASISPAEYFDYAERAGDVFEAFGVYSAPSVAITGGDRAERVPGAQLTAGVLAALRVIPVRGRLISQTDDQPGAAPVALLAEGVARRRFGHLDVVGREIIVNGVSTTVIGVLPPDFRLPTDFAVDAAEVFLPLRLDRAAITARGSHFLVGVARLREGVPPEQASARLDGITRELVADFPDDYPRDMRFGAHIVSIRRNVNGDVRPVLLLLLGAVALVLVVTCANVASLMLARSDARRREFAVRTALGASRGRIARQLLAESLTLAAFAGTAGVISANWGVSALLALQPQSLPRADEVGLDLRVLAYAAAITVLTALLFGLAPLLQSERQPANALRESGRTAGSGPARQYFRQTLVAVELCLAVVLLSGAGLLMRSLASLLDVDPGYDSRNVLTTRITLPPSLYGTDLSRRDYFTRLEQRAADLPRVLAAGAATQLPLSNPLGDLNIRIEGREVREGEVSPRLDWQTITPGYFDAIGMRLLRGRGIARTDDESTPGVVVLNESAAQLHFPSEEAIGRRFRLGGNAGPGWVTVVGIVQDIRHARLDQPPRPEMYLAHRQFRFWNGGLAANAMTLVVRTAGDPAPHATAVRRLLYQLDPDVPPDAFLTMEDARSGSVARPRFITTLLGAFAAVALLLGAVGIFGLVSHAVGLRRQELGLRVALGARAASILGLVLRQGLPAAAAGMGIGTVAALLLTRTLTGLLYEVNPADPATLATVIGVLAAAVLTACIIPARRALRTDPMLSMRAE